MPSASVASTSRAAFASTRPKLPSIRDQVLEILDAADAAGATRDEIMAQFGERARRGGTVSGRMSELEADCLIFRTEDTRVGDSGLEQIVWRHHRLAAVMRVSMPTTPKSAPTPGKGFKAGVKWLAENLIKQGVTVHPDVKRALIESLRKVTNP